jgi:hypothetical protein
MNPPDGAAAEGKPRIQRQASRKAADDAAEYVVPHVTVCRAERLHCFHVD